jgi:hypothetical protein
MTTIEVEATDLTVGDRIIGNAGGRAWDQRPDVVEVTPQGADHVSVLIDTRTNGRHRVTLHRYHELEVAR